MMSKIKILISCVAAFIFVAVYEFILHGILLKDLYTQSAHLWRPQAEMQNYFVYMTICQLISSIILVFFYLQKHENKGWTEGLRFGLFVGGLMGVNGFSFYAVSPIPLSLAIYWFLGSFIESSLLGILLALINSSKK
jgi:hypothetical protein